MTRKLSVSLFLVRQAHSSFDYKQNFFFKILINCKLLPN
jgi:hypothetical protein